MSPHSPCRYTPARAASRAYRDGQAVCADEGMKYKMETVNGLNYVVNESGKIKTSGTAKDADGLKYTIKKNSAGGYDITTEYVD